MKLDQEDSMVVRILTVMVLLTHKINVQMMLDLLIMMDVQNQLKK